MLRGAEDGATLIARRLGWACRLHGDSVIEKVDLGMVDKLAITRGLDRGLVAMPSKVLVWIGSDADQAAAAFKGFLIAHGGDGSTWIASETAKGPIAHELRAMRSPMGRLAWLLGDSEQPVICDGQTPGGQTSRSSKAGVGDAFGTPMAGFHVIVPATSRDLLGRPS